MLISYSRKFIFFHVAKVAGLSIRDALDEYCQKPEKFKIKRPLEKVDSKPNPLYEMWEVMLLHARARDAKKELSVDVYDNFYKFAFVRNPWDWQVSMYHFILKETDHVRHELVRSMSNFDEYIEWAIHEKKPFARGATKYQKDMVTNSQGELIVDFIGRYETLNQDFERICQKIGIEATLPALNRTRHRDYRTYYNIKTRQLVAEHFGEDIEILKYTFDGYETI